MVWEYRVEPCRGSVADARWLNELGKQGWELVALLSHVEVDDFVGQRTVTCAYLKRPRPGGQEEVSSAEEAVPTHIGMRQI